MVLINNTGYVNVGISSYELNVLSAEKDSVGKKLKKYNINGADTLGVYENEPFEIEFKNNSWSKVQVRISIDGTDVITGTEANLKPEGEMWVVDPYSSIKLKAWPESTKGGSSFIFGKVNDSVAKHTHGNLSARGIISAAVFTEATSYTWHYQTFPWYETTHYYGVSYGATITRNTGNTTFATNNITGADIPTTLDACSYDQDSNYLSASVAAPAVGAGEYVDQSVVKVAGLNTPTFNTVIVVKYEWWTKLKSDLRKLGFADPDLANIGFPGEQKMIDLKSTPKKGKQPKQTKKPKKKYIELERFVNV